jgi:hypothetical protein
MASRRIAAVLACLIFAVVVFVPSAGAQGILPCGIIDPCPGPPPPPGYTPPAPGPSTPSIWVENKKKPYQEGKPYATLGKPLNLLGWANDVRGQSIDASDVRELRLYADQWPYGHETLIAAIASQSNGGYEFSHLLPQLNTRYRVEEWAYRGPQADYSYVGENRLQVFVFPRIRSFRVRVLPSGIGAVARLAIKFPKIFRFPLNHRPIYWYIHRKHDKLRGEPEWLLVGRGRTATSRANLVTARDRLHLPRQGRYRFFTVFCFNIAPGHELGMGIGPDTGCPKHRHSTPSDFGQ